MTPSKNKAQSRPTEMPPRQDVNSQEPPTLVRFFVTELDETPLTHGSFFRLYILLMFLQIKEMSDLIGIVQTLPSLKIIDGRTLGRP
jgi:hypothetical protein